MLNFVLTSTKKMNIITLRRYYMAKKKIQKSINYIKYGAIIFAIVGAVMTLFNFVYFGEDYAYTGLQVIFGYSKTLDLGITQSTTHFLTFSILALLTVVLPIIGSFSTLFKSKFIRLIGALMMIAGTVMCFFIPNFIVYANEAQQVAHQLIGSSLGIGAILSGVFFGIGSLCNLYSIIKK